MAKSKDNSSRKSDSKKNAPQKASAKKSDGDGKKSSRDSSKAKQPEKSKEAPKQDSTRETVESIVVAFVLAFLFRGFEAEAFVIPTGSMAPTLYGRHKEADCEQCGYHILIGASDEMNDKTGYFDPSKRIQTAVCPNCRFSNDVRDAPVFKGDRILVNKFPYEFSDPQRWDVPVFKFPENPTTNYIKRLVGLPNETLVIKRGNVYRIEEDRTRSILRKPPSRQKAIQIPVFDNNYRETALHEKGWPQRWAAVERVAGDSPVTQRQDQLGLGPIAGWTEAADSWNDEAEGGTFVIDKTEATGESLKWLRYRHIIPSPGDWDAAEDGPLALSDHQYFFDDAEAMGPRSQLISDFCGYNTYTGGHSSPYDDPFWVADLTVTCDVEILEAGDQAEVVVELNEGVQCYRCRIDVSTGNARLVSVNRFSGSGENEEPLAEAKTDLIGTGDWQLRFANVDNRICLWIDDDLVEFGDAANYAEDESQTPSPQDDDLIPVGIAVRNAGVLVSNLLIERDIYYRASWAENDIDDRGDPTEVEHPEPYSLRRALHDPVEWYTLYSDRARGSNNKPESRFELGPDEYLMLGDNSPRSQDSRVWANARHAKHRHAVPRSALVGRAFYIYWPHGIPFLNDGEGIPVTYHKKLTGDGVKKTEYPSFRVPFYPNFSRMDRIR